MSHKQTRIVLQRKTCVELARLPADGNTPQKIVKRVRIVPMNADGHGVAAIMRQVGVTKTTVWRWQEYFLEAGVGGLVKGPTKLPGKLPLSEEVKRTAVEKTVKARPVNATRWTVRSMAEEMGISHIRIWAEYGLKPHLVRGFKVSNDPDFTPTSSSWINLVERLFAENTRQRIRRGTFNDVNELKAAISAWIEHRNHIPKPFKWTTSAKSVLAKYRRAKKAPLSLRRDANE